MLIRELGSIIRIIGAGRMELDGACAMSSATDFETYARDCVKLAEQPDAPPELREQLLQMAREWMQAMMEAGNFFSAALGRGTLCSTGEKSIGNSRVSVCESHQRRLPQKVAPFS